MTTTPDRFVPTTNELLEVHIALQQSTDPSVRDAADWCHHTCEAITLLRRLLVVLDEMPPAHDGPAERHLRWARLVRQRAQQTLTALPEDRTAPSRPLPVRVRFGQPHSSSDDQLLDTILPDQNWLRALRDDVECVLCAPGCEDARTTTNTMQALVRLTNRYLAEVELADAAGVLGFTNDGTADGRY